MVWKENVAILLFLNMPFTFSLVKVRRVFILNTEMVQLRQNSRSTDDISIEAELSLEAKSPVFKLKPSSPTSR